MNLTIDLHSGLIRTMDLTQTDRVWERHEQSDDFIPSERTMHLTMSISEILRVTTQPT